MSDCRRHRRPEVAPVRPGEELDWSALEVYLRAHLPQVHGELSVLQFPNGSANLTYLVRFGEEAVVVRRPPFGAIAAGAHDMRREHTVLSRLHAAYPRAPLGLHYCADESVIGAHFLVSEYRTGVVVWDRVPDAARRRTGSRPPDRVRRGRRARRPAPGRPRRLRAGRPGPTRRLPRATGRRLAATVGGGRARRARRPSTGWASCSPGTFPESGPPALVHNDFKVDNCQFAAGDPERGHVGLRLGHGDARRPAHRPRHPAELLARRDRRPPTACPVWSTSVCPGATRSSSATPRGRAWT